MIYCTKDNLTNKSWNLLKPTCIIISGEVFTIHLSIYLHLYSPLMLWSISSFVVPRAAINQMIMKYYNPKKKMKIKKLQTQLLFWWFSSHKAINRVWRCWCILRLGKQQKRRYYNFVRFRLYQFHACRDRKKKCHSTWALEQHNQGPNFIWATM